MMRIGIGNLLGAYIDAYHRFADYEIKSTEVPEQTAAAMLDAIKNHRYGE